MSKSYPIPSPLIISKAMRMTLRGRYLALALGSGAALSLLFQLIIPVLTVPGNDLWLQLQILKAFPLLPLVLAMELASGVLLAMYAYLMRHRNPHLPKGAAGGAASAGGSVTAVMFGTAACPACIGAMFGFLGTPGILFLVNYGSYVAVAGAIGIFAALWYVSAELMSCPACKIK